MQDWEIVDMTWLWEDLYETKIWFREVDKLLWIPSKRKGFPDEDLLQCIVGGGTDFPWKCIWKVCPAKGCFPFLVHGSGEGIDSGKFEKAVNLDILNVIRRTLGLWINFENSFVSFPKNVLTHQLINKLSSCYWDFLGIRKGQ